MHDLVHFPQCVSEILLREFLRTTILPMGDRVGFARGEPLVLQSSPFVSVFGWAVVLSALVGALSLAIAVILVLLTCAPACKPIPRRWVHPCQGACKLYPRILILPLAKLKLLAT